MEPFVVLKGLAAPLDRSNVDTDQILPAVHLKRIKREGFGQFLFGAWRFLEDGRPNPDFELNQPRYQGATILVTGPNFGSGSSREHAPWALLDYGFRAIIAPSFADIFRNNCFQNGMLPVELDDKHVADLIKNANEVSGYQITVDLETCHVYDDHGFKASFELDSFRRECLLKGLDDIGLTLQHEHRINDYETSKSPL